MIATLLGFVGITAALLAFAAIVHRLIRHRPRRVRRAGRCIVAALGLASLPPASIAAYMTFCLAAGQPRPEERPIARGLVYRRLVIAHPREAVVHVAEIDLTRGLRFAVTPPVSTPEDPRAAAQTATQALERLEADLVINASYFSPFRESHPFDFYPRSGQIVTPLGTTIGSGHPYGWVGHGWVTFWADPIGRVGFGPPPIGADQAVSGPRWLVHQGAIAVEPGDDPYPRTALAMDAPRRRLWFVVVDGKQPRYSLGLTGHELARLLLRMGASDAIELDGGGSATMAGRDARGRPTLLNRPCHTKIPGRQRPVANHLGVIVGAGPASGRD